MAKAETQKRWRARTDRKRIELYLPADTLAALDAMPGTRAQAIQALLEARGRSEPDSTAISRPYRLRRPNAGERGADWIMLLDGQPWAEIERTASGWRARTLKRSLTWRWCTGKRRDDVARRLFEKPDIWQ